MHKHARFSILMALLLVVGFAGGILFVSILGSAPRPARAEAASRETPALTPQGRELLGQFSVAFEAAAAKVNPSVVTITSEQVQKVDNPLAGNDLRQFFGDDFFKRFFGGPGGNRKQTVRSLGSGVIVSSDGFILTNNHVVSGADKLDVALEDKKTYRAKLVGADPQTDLAVIKIDAHDLRAANLGDSDTLKVGQWVIAVGNPFQLVHTVTQGIISAEGRSRVNLADYEDFIQTDASINPGNSGGALADLDGNVIGINTAILSPSGANAGIGFAIPINMAKTVMHDLMDKGKVTRGYVGLLLQDINDDLAKAMKLKTTEGALVADVTPGAPAEKAGISRGDIITEYEGKHITSTDQLRNMVAAGMPGSTVNLTLLRQGKEKDVAITLGERPPSLAASGPSREKSDKMTSTKLGLSVENLSPDLAKQLGYRSGSGVIIAEVTAGSPAEDAGLQHGDLIKEVDQKPVRSVSEFEQALGSLKSGESVAFLIQRGDNSFFAALSVQ